MANTKKIIENILLGIVAIIAVFTILGDTSGDINSAAGNVSEEVNASGHCVSGGDCAGSTLPLAATFFKKKGLVLLIFMIAIVLLLMGLFMSSKK